MNLLDKNDDFDFIKLELNIIKCSKSKPLTKDLLKKQINVKLMKN